MQNSLPEDVSSAFKRVVNFLGEVFSFEQLVEFICLWRQKNLLFEQEALPMTTTAYCIALKDVDLVSTRKGLDPILRRVAQLHELSHILLQHVPAVTNEKTPTYAEFQQLRGAGFHAITRSLYSPYNIPQERSAEILATLLLHCIEQERTSTPSLARELF